MAVAPSPGDKIGGRYEIEAFIGAGGMQNVFRAMDTLFTRRVALKVPKEDAALKRFQKSAVVSARVNHPNVAKTLDYLEDDTGSYLIEELVDGVDLSNVFPSPVPILPPSVAARIFHMLAKGLAASHHAGVVHRDLKPSNIMVAGGLQLSDLKITDFGIAKMAEAEIGQWAEGTDKGSTSSKTVLGAIPYMAPESITDFKTASYPSDVWAIAAMTYELFAGSKPYGGNLASIPHILTAAPPKKPEWIDAPQFRQLGGELYDIILACLQKDPAKRPTADDLVKTMEGVCYSLYQFEIGKIKQVRNSAWGFISADAGSDLLYHRDNFYGPTGVIAVGDRLWFGRHPGQGNDRAVPIVKLKNL